MLTTQSHSDTPKEAVGKRAGPRFSEWKPGRPKLGPNLQKAASARATGDSVAVEKVHEINNESISISTTVEINETDLNMKIAELQTSSTGNNTEDTFYAKIYLNFAKEVRNFITGRIEDVTVSFLVDTGAEPTIISLKALQTLPRHIKEAFEKYPSHLKLANGQRVAAKGPVMCKIQVGNKSVLEATYAAQIDDEVILGLETLKGLGFDLTIAGMPMTMTSDDNTEVSHKIRRVLLTEDCVILGVKC